MIYAMLLTLLYDCKEWEVTLILSFYLQESEKECRKRLPLWGLMAKGCYLGCQSYRLTFLCRLTCWSVSGK